MHRSNMPSVVRVGSGFFYFRHILDLTTEMLISFQPPEKIFYSVYLNN